MIISIRPQGWELRPCWWGSSSNVNNMGEEAKSPKEGISSDIKHTKATLVEIIIDLARWSALCSGFQHACNGSSDAGDRLG